MLTKYIKLVEKPMKVRLLKTKKTEAKIVALMERIRHKLKIWVVKIGKKKAREEKESWVLLQEGYSRVISAMDALARVRKVRVNGRVKISENSVWESILLKIVKGWEFTGKDEAWNREQKRKEMKWREEGEDETSAWERRIEAEKGRTRRMVTDMKVWYP